MKATRAEDEKPRTPRRSGARSKPSFRIKKLRMSKLKASDAGILDIWKHVDARDIGEEVV